jgi:hypothetical protein
MSGSKASFRRPRQAWVPMSPRAVKEEPMMDRTSLDQGSISRLFDSVLPETLEEAEQLAASIERAVQQETGGGVQNLGVEISREGILLTGRCTTFYCKQLAQQAVMAMQGGDRLTNRIEVS